MSDLAAHHSAEFRRCLLELDVVAIRQLWKYVSPHLPQPKSDHDALVTLHAARTRANSVAINLRAYSHRWLLDNGHPSGLPDELKPSAERMYPRIADAVGISVNSKYVEVRKCVQSAMSNAVLDAYAEGRTEPEFVKERMHEARRRERKALGL